MRYLRVLGLSLGSLASTPWRSLLLVAVVAVSIAGVFLSIAVGSGAKREVLRGMEALVPELVVVRPVDVKQLQSRREISGLAETLRIEDCEAVRRLDTVRDAAPALEAMIPVRSEGGALLTKVMGTTEAFIGVRRFRIDRGRFLDDDDDRSLRRCAVIGARVAEALFSGTSAIGETLRIRGVPYEVVGTLEPKGVSPDGADNDNLVLVPVRTALRRLHNQRYLTTIFVNVSQPSALVLAERQITALLRERHRIRGDAATDDFAIQDQRKLVGAQSDAAASLGAATTKLAFLALFLGGFGILGLMLLNVRDRTPEIGLLMALGARSSDIGLQFLSEATLVSVAGGVLGVGLGLVGARVVSLVTAWPTECSLDVGAAAFASAILLGVVFGVVPAIGAARLPPVQSLARE